MLFGETLALSFEQQYIGYIQHSGNTNRDAMVYWFSVLLNIKQMICTQSLIHEKFFFWRVLLEL